MDDYEPSISFGETVAEIYDDIPRGDDSASTTHVSVYGR